LEVTFDPRLPAIPQILRKHWRTMVKNDQHLAKVFPLPPFTAYVRPHNIKTKLSRSKIPETRGREKRNVPGMKNCQKNCAIFPYISNGKSSSS
jgi:hypothetical protein